MKDKRMSKIQAEEEYRKLVNKNFKVDDNELDFEEKIIRKELLKHYEDVKKSAKKQYDIDLLFGLSIYEFLNEKFNLNKDYTISSNVMFWIYLSMKIIPDIVYKRWKDTPARFYKHNKRIWLLSIWWYIHLSWQGDKEKTYNVIKDNSTDTILQLLERVGVGYDLKLTKELMRRLSFEKVKGDLFRRVMVLNTIYIHTIHPQLFENGYQGYVEMLFEKAKI